MPRTSPRLACFPIIACLLLPASAIAQGGEYDPLAVSTQDASRVVDLIVMDFERQRDIPVRVYLPQAATPAPVILFSHGLGGSREGSAYLGRHWACRGYAVVFLQHPGSDSSVWKGKPVAERMRAMEEAASDRNFMLRVGDVSAVLDQLEQWNKAAGHVLAERLNPFKTGMSGHSFGAVTTQAVSGQRTVGGKATFRDARIAAALIMSPSSPRGGTPQEAFGEISSPWMLMTGTEDTAPIGNVDMTSRLAVFPALPPAGIPFRGMHRGRSSSDHVPGDNGPVLDHGVRVDVDCHWKPEGAPPRTSSGGCPMESR